MQQNTGALSKQVLAAPQLTKLKRILFRELRIKPCYPPIMENQMKKKMEHTMETGGIYIYIHIYRGFNELELRGFWIQGSRLSSLKLLSSPPFLRAQGPFWSLLALRAWISLRPTGDWGVLIFGIYTTSP